MSCYFLHTGLAVQIPQPNGTIMACLGKKERKKTKDTVTFVRNSVHHKCKIYTEHTEYEKTPYFQTLNRFH